MEALTSDPLPAVRLTGVSKHFRLYREKNDSLKATITRLRRARYEDFLVLSDISLDFYPGATVGIIGSNGSGKSTLLKLIAEIISPDSGQVISRGRLIALLELGAGFHPELTGRENIYLNGAILGLSHSKIQDSIDEIVSFAELEDFIDIAIKHYSSGMIIRLGFAIAAHVDPDILIVDEVLSVGDASFQAKSLNKIRDFKNAGKTVIIVSHDLGLLKDVCERIIWLQDGKVREDGMSEVILERYLSHESEKVIVPHGTETRPSNIIKHVSVSDGRYNDTGIFKPNTSIQLSLILENFREHNRIAVVFCIKNEDNRIVWQNHESSCIIETQELQTQTLSLVCDIETFHFAEGIFTLTIIVVDPQTSTLIDEWNNPTRINIVRDESADYGFSTLSAKIRVN